MEQTWRWFGHDDKVSLAEIRQTGATGVVTALHHIAYGVTWSRDEIVKRKNIIEAAGGLRWSVVESLPVAEAIKLGEGDLPTLFENYRAIAAQSRSRRCHDRLLQFHAGARLDPHTACDAVAEWRHGPALQRA